MSVGNFATFVTYSSRQTIELGRQHNYNRWTYLRNVLAVIQLFRVFDPTVQETVLRGGFTTYPFNEVTCSDLVRVNARNKWRQEETMIGTCSRLLIARTSQATILITPVWSMTMMLVGEDFPADRLPSTSTVTVH